MTVEADDQGATAEDVAAKQHLKGITRRTGELHDLYVGHVQAGGTKRQDQVNEVNDGQRGIR